MFWVLFLLVSWAGVLWSCTLLLAAATRAAEPATGAATAPHHDELSLYEAAYLAGGPGRVAELTLLSMQRRRRLLLAHTGWATVVDPVGHDAHEWSVLGAFGSDGQSPVPDLRSTAAADEAVRALADRLGEAGLAVPAGSRRGVADGVRAVRGATLLVLAMAAASVTLPAGAGMTHAMILAWFSLPLILGASCLAIARFEAHPYSRWASPAGQRLLVALDRERSHRDSLTAVAVRGVRVVSDPGLRAALGYGNRGWFPRQRGH
ncbi:TIGR04222 domain-containing membrane protein [Streptomyces sp. ISL-94]|uniref:TIGR04222 domain-containing membrane protein n=1 Tax=Streptomyces sp. ISL-94 TaxID=2819190 RepID=UPI001BE866ED|nr:TIGR04222 domain-containing membrane protein [Streptomyces sp. ISL-94]MBT2477203.1 TIGR04222 domain-containing membrane protein [Streptomyces sp. ISL-94]